MKGKRYLNRSLAVLLSASMSMSMLAVGAFAEEPSTGDSANAAGEAYVLMNIPYGEFYENELNNEVAVDVFTSATLNKTRTSNLAGGSYHVDSNGTDITGITYPVKVADLSQLESYTQITDDSSVTITVTNRGQTTETTYTGAEALFESESYSYYVLNEEEAQTYVSTIGYKTLTVDEAGELTFSEVNEGARSTVEAAATLTTESSYGDYQISVDAEVLDEVETVYAVVLNTKEGDTYGLRHMENVWLVTELAFCTGFTPAVHNCPTSSEHYEAIMGQTITSIVYYTEQGIFTLDLSEELYVPTTLGDIASVADADVNAGSTTVSFSKELPADFDAVYAVEGLESTVEGANLAFTNAKPGAYTLKVSDNSGKYAAIFASFTLTTENIPVVYDETAFALMVAEGADEAAVADYLNGINRVTVNGRAYATSGRGAVTMINKDGTLNKEAAPLAESGTYAITVSAAGYPDVTFTYVVEDAPEISFTDVNESDWFYNPVQWAVKNNVTAGVGDGLFAPMATCTREQIVTLLWNAAGKPEAETSENPFTDVKEGDWYYTAVLWAVENNITAGMGDGIFGVGQACTRAQAVTFLWNQAGKIEASASATSPFSDVEQGDWYYSAVLWAVENNITAGMGDGTFGSTNICNRAQIVTFLRNQAERT